MRTSQLAVGSILIAATVSVASVARPAGESEPAEPLAVVPWTPYLGKLHTITVAIGDTDAPFLFDTGGGATCITPELAGEIGCEPYGQASGFRLSGERVTFQWCDDAVLTVAGVPLSVELSVFDIMSLLGDAPPLGGLVSVHTFARQPFTIDFDGTQLILESEASLRARIEDLQPLSARFAHQAGGASLDPFIEVRAETGTLWLELDSGNLGRTILAPHTAQQLGLATTEDQVVALDIMGLGPVPLQVRFLDGCIYDGVVGVEFFQGRLVTIDATRGEIWAGR